VVVAASSGDRGAARGGVRGEARGRVGGAGRGAPRPRLLPRATRPTGGRGGARAVGGGGGRACRWRAGEHRLHAPNGGGGAPVREPQLSAQRQSKFHRNDALAGPTREPASWWRTTPPNGGKRARRPQGGDGVDASAAAVAVVRRHRRRGSTPQPAARCPASGRRPSRPRRAVDAGRDGAPCVPAGATTCVGRKEARDRRRGRNFSLKESCKRFRAGCLGGRSGLPT